VRGDELAAETLRRDAIRTYRRFGSSITAAVRLSWAVVALGSTFVQVAAGRVGRKE
jgi:hypothetical protein